MKDLNNLTNEEIKNNYGENQYEGKNKKYRWTTILGYTGRDSILANVLEGDFWNEEEKASIRRLVGKNEKMVDWGFITKDCPFKENLDILVVFEKHKRAMVNCTEITRRKSILRGMDV